MLARLSKTLSTNIAVAGATAVVLGAGGSTVAFVGLTADHQTPVTGEHADDQNEQGDDQGEAADPAETEAPDSADSSDTGVRPTDTHGYCVSQIAQAPLPAGSTVNHGSLVSAAAHACGKDQKTTGADSKKQAGKHLGRDHGTGKPAGVPAH